MYVNIFIYVYVYHVNPIDVLPYMLLLSYDL